MPGTPAAEPGRERLDPNKLISYGLSISQVENQLSLNNTNAGGSFIQAGPQQINVQAQGLFRNVQDIEKRRKGVGKPCNALAHGAVS